MNLPLEGKSILSIVLQLIGGRDALIVVQTNTTIWLRGNVLLVEHIN
jgi:hypothetical protein